MVKSCKAGLTNEVKKFDQAAVSRMSLGGFSRVGVGKSRGENR